MTEVWLRTNRRAVAFGMILPTAGVLLGAWLALSAPGSYWPWLGPLGWLVVAGCGGLLAVLAWQARRPRIARRGEWLLFYLQAGPPLPVPLDLVEGLLLGTGASYLRSDRPDASETRTIVVRLAERDPDLARRDVRPALGSWCNHYVTIRGTWCEPLSVALVERLNARLAAAQQALRKGAGQP